MKARLRFGSAGAWLLALTLSTVPVAEASDAPSPSTTDYANSYAFEPERAPALFSRRDVLLAASVGVVLIPVGTNDVWFRDEARESNSKVARTVARIAEPIGNGSVVVPALAVAYLAARAAHDPDLAARFARVAISTGAAGVAAIGLKEVAGRSRPPQAPDDADEIRLFSGHDSFPSGHTVIAFAAAAAINHEFTKSWLPWVTYPVATMVGWSRIHDDRHWTSDVVAGAAFGIWTARKSEIFLRSGSRRRMSLGVIPWLPPGGSGLAITLRH